MEGKKEEKQKYSKQPAICVVGSCNTDLLAKIPRFPRIGETVIGNHFHIGFGGKGANQAVMAALLGGKITIVTKLGRDTFGEDAFKNFRERGIVTRYIYWDSKTPSGVAPILVDEKGNKILVVVPGANFNLTPEDVRKAADAIRNADMVLCQLEIPQETTLEALKIARSERIPTLLNPAPGFPLSDEFFKLSNIIASNKLEASAILNREIETIEDARNTVKEFQKRGCECGIITLGKRGAVAGNKNGIFHIPSISVNTIDSTGAGDAFIGTFVYYYAAGFSFRESVWRGNVSAALSTTALGTQLSFQSKEKIEAGYANSFKDKLHGR
jgi:ribokinase